MSRAQEALSPRHYSGEARPQRHLLTVNLEDYYHVSPFGGLIEQHHWSRFERRLEVGTQRTLDMLDEYGVHATFFALGWVADVAPELLREVVARGHEIASKGYHHRSLREMGRNGFREDLLRARDALERATGRRIVGHRVAEKWLSPDELWALDVLTELGYQYDSSLNPLLRAHASRPDRHVVHQHHGPSGSIWEIPISSTGWAGLRVPIGGGNYFRQFPSPLVRRAVAHWHRTVPAPFVMYFHTWELDPAQPRIAAPLLARVRQYRNLNRMEAIVRYYLERYAFQSVGAHLGLGAQPDVAHAAGPAIGGELDIAVPASGSPGPTPLTIVVPCYNEESGLPFLANTLAELRPELEPRYALRCVVVDDGSSDGTWAVAHKLFGGRADFHLVRHDRNRGLGAAIQTGLSHARSEIVCSIDCDCTYDPRELIGMIPLLTEGVDVVTASPYHPEGTVRNVPAWRLSLSRVASALYRRVLGSRLHTFTSCCRVYRRSSVASFEVRRGGFLGVAELIGKVELAGGRVVEHPATLNVRLLGRSKMKTLRTIGGHLGLLLSLGLERARRRRRPARDPRPAPVRVPARSESAG